MGSPVKIVISTGRSQEEGFLFGIDTD